MEYWEAVLWAADYRDYVGARASVNKNIVYIGGVLALASAGALVGLAAFGHAGSDPSKIIPIAGTFIAGLLGYSKNDALYEAYQTAEAKIDTSIRHAAKIAQPKSSPAYQEASALLRDEVGRAIDDLNHTKLEIIKFQAKGEAEQFKEFQQATYAKDLGQYALRSVHVDPPNNPTKIIATLNSAPDAQILPANELRLKLTDPAGQTETIQVTGVKGSDLEAVVPPSLLNRGSRRYLVHVQARSGSFTMAGADTVTLSYDSVRLTLTVNGTGSVNITAPDGTLQHCEASSPCLIEKVPMSQSITFTATANSAQSETGASWQHDASTCGRTNGDVGTCTLSFHEDADVVVEFTH